jgi:uncharacterized protein DUF4255/IPT/TIG domain-containing protein
MSNPFAIAAVTATFRQLLLRVLEEPSLTGTGVSMFPPDAARGNGSERQLNLFLYQVSPNEALRNAELPVRRSDGTLRKPPVLALNLHYLITAYGLNDDQKDTQHLLAHAMSVVHDNPIFSREQIRNAITGDTAVGASDLANQFELVKLSPHSMSTEDLFKLWSAFQTHYRLSVGYDASVVLIERPHRTAAPLPVSEASLYVLPFGQPRIDDVFPQSLPAGGQLTVRGHNLKGDVVKVRLGTVLIDPDTVSGSEILLTLPTSLLAGVNTVQVIHSLLMGKPPVPHRGFESNVAAFVLVPRITSADPITVARGSNLTLSLAPPVGRSQQVILLVGDQGLPLPPRPPSAPATASSLGFPIPASFPTGTFLLRVRVDGAESPLRADAATGAYVGPQVIIT